MFLRTFEAEDKAATLLRAIRDPEAARGKWRFEVDAESFSSVPRSPFAYWISKQLRRRFEELPPLQAEARFAAFGASTKNDFRYLRLWCEVVEARTASSRRETESKSWVRFCKGGSFATYYADPHLLLWWLQDGVELKTDISEYRGSRGWGYLWSAALNGHDHYFRPGLTWSRRTQSGLAMRAMPAGCIFADKGPAVFVATDNTQELLALLAIVNATTFRALVGLQMAFGSYEVGVIQSTPFPHLTPANNSILATLSRRAWSLKRSLDTHTETSHAFTLPVLLSIEGATLVERSAAWVEHLRRADAELATIQADIDARCFDLYGIEDADRRAISDDFGSRANTNGVDTDTDSDADSDSEDAEETAADATSLTEELMAWAIGVAFGRFDVRLATSARSLPAEPEPFDPLPVCSPAMLTGDNGLPLTRAPKGYPLTLPKGGLLVGDSGHPLDLTTAARAVFDIVFGASSDARWEEAAAILDPREHDLRNWIAKGFFDHHLRRYSKSRRKAPIVWQLATPSASYSVWLYAHRLTKDSLFQVQNDLVAQKVIHEERRQRALATAAGSSPTAAQRKEIAAQDALIDELRAMLDEVKRIAPLWSPNLDDGVVLTMAPLWRLVPQHKTWQKELRTAWDRLSAGKFDWAHLAMHLWPERVVPKCATDRSLAIAHGLEDVFWIEGADGKWQPRKAPTSPEADLIRERTSPAVRAALQSLASVPRAAEPRPMRRDEVGELALPYARRGDA